MNVVIAVPGILEFLDYTPEMNIAIFGTGTVGRTLASKVSEVGNSVYVGTRNVQKTLSSGKSNSDDPDSISAWLDIHPGISLVPFAEAAAKSEIVFLAVSAQAALPLLKDLDPKLLAGKILVDLTNPLDFSKGMPLTLSIVNDDSLGEQIQSLVPEARVVKTLNMVTSSLMVDPQELGPDHTMCLSGNDSEAKKVVTDMLKNWFGWSDVIDLGDIRQARGMEMYLPLWLRMWGALGTAKFNIKIVR